MSANGIVFSVFTKPWKMPIPELGQFVKALGFDAIELPVRPGFQVLPERVERDLPAAAKQLADCGVSIASVAGPTDEATISACAQAGVPTIRVMVYTGKESYLTVEQRTQAEYEALVPLLERYGVQIGVQNHCDQFVASAAGLRRVVEPFDPKYVAAVWDAAHCALNGEDPELAADILWSHLCMVNLKNAYWQRTNGPEAEVAQWRHHWTTGRHGLAPWPRVAAELKRRGYRGVICLTAEYSDEPSVDRLIAEDIAFAKSLFV
ncbi:MAG: sugar phosphate isomerase/epimerase family protein [Armatimonadota bacterium]